MQASQKEKIGDDIQSLSDSALMKSLEKGNMSALEEIYMRYGDMVKTVIYRTIPNVDTADVEDLTQEIFITLLRSASRFDGSKRLRPWLYGIAANKAADSRRSTCLHAALLNRHRVAEQLVQPPFTGSVDTKLDLRKQLTQAFSTLPREQHDVMVLHVIEGFKGAEIADILGIEVNTVWVRLHRARKRLFEQMTLSTKDEF
ncbi:MAG: RNA polymerase sigma factor [Deltaproteobacteria bacterium]|nr:RNA polymerase sigma factor [Deltaproteobacteria bacterium]